MQVCGTGPKMELQSQTLENWIHTVCFLSLHLAGSSVNTAVNTELRCTLWLVEAASTLTSLPRRHEGPTRTAIDYPASSARTCSDRPTAAAFSADTVKYNSYGTWLSGHMNLKIVCVHAHTQCQRVCKQLRSFPEIFPHSTVTLSPGQRTTPEKQIIPLRVPKVFFLLTGKQT